MSKLNINEDNTVLQVPISPEALEELYRTFLKWNVAPKTSADPRTLSEFATKYSLTKQHLDSFVSREEYHNDLLRMAILWGKSKVPDILRKTFSEATEDRGNPTAAAKFIDMIVDLDESQKKPDKSNEGKINNTFIINHINNDKLRELTNRIARKTGLLDGSSETRSIDVLSDN